jgi:tRNA threonylcarbamoyladenosine biosynthesis protein TsaE
MVIMMPEYISNSQQDTKDLGRNLGKLLKGGEIILLHGDLGAGKTLFTKGIAEGLGVEDSTAVVSPSFTLVNIYKARLDIVHVDLYRLDSDEIYELGLEDYMDQEHVIVVEWAEKVHDFFSGRIIDITIGYMGEATRKITLNCQQSLTDTRVTGLFPG